MAGSLVFLIIAKIVLYGYKNMVKVNPEGPLAVECTSRPGKGRVETR
jgi:hypothetical protein